MALNFEPIGAAATGSLALVGSFVGNGLSFNLTGVDELGSFVIKANTINNGVIIQGTCGTDVDLDTEHIRVFGNLSGTSANSTIFNIIVTSQGTGAVNFSAVIDNMTKTEDNVVIILGSEGTTGQRMNLSNVWAMSY